jgi:outer membrane PBP1 activator LpoA protein
MNLLLMLPQARRWLKSSLPWLASVAWAAHASAQTLPAPSTPAVSPPAAVGAPAGAPLPTKRPAVLLLLPSAASPFARPAEALLAGFLAAHKVAGDEVSLQVVELEDGSEPLAAALAAARERRVSVVVGPLPRAAVTDIVDGQRSAPPLVALNFPESDRPAPPTMLAAALSLETEAQGICQLALAQFVGTRRADTRPRIAVVTGAGALDRRIAQAYVQALRREGENPRLVEWTPATTAAAAAQLNLPSLEAVFLALNARDAAQMRALIPRTAQIFGTSLLYIGDPRTSPDAATIAHDLEGVRFVDMPWFLQPDHSGVMVYPPADVALPAELVRLYAFGIDAYRLAIAWMKGERRFDIDGVTGRLRIDREQSMRVERQPLLAVYRGGAVQRIDLAR